MGGGEGREEEEEGGGRAHVMHGRDTRARGNHPSWSENHNGAIARARGRPASDRRGVGSDGGRRGHSDGGGGAGSGKARVGAGHIRVIESSAGGRIGGERRARGRGRRTARLLRSAAHAGASSCWRDTQVSKTRGGGGGNPGSTL